MERSSITEEKAPPRDQLERSEGVGLDFHDRNALPEYSHIHVSPAHYCPGKCPVSGLHSGPNLSHLLAGGQVVPSGLLNRVAVRSLARIEKVRGSISSC